jgi:hypothetical protein
VIYWRTVNRNLPVFRACCIQLHSGETACIQSILRRSHTSSKRAALARMCFFSFAPAQLIYSFCEIVDIIFVDDQGGNDDLFTRRDRRLVAFDRLSH